jgi:hypothetical protein
LLDELRAGGKVKGPANFVKIDVDGHELEVLRGARSTFLKDRPTTLIELAPHVQDEIPERFESLLSTLQEYGYRLEDVQSGATLPMSAQALRTRIADGVSIDAIARPS